MSSTPPSTDRPADAPTRRRLTRQVVLAGAVELADRLGTVEDLTIRKLADHLGVKPMSIYHHVPSKDEILDGMVDAVFAEIELPSAAGEWRPEIRRRAISARAALNRHPWATGLLDSRTNPGPATLRHHDAIIACLRHNGFGGPSIGRAVAVIDAFVYGFALQEAALPGTNAEELTELAADLMAVFEAEYPDLAWFTRNHVLAPHYSFSAEFEPGLDLVLDGLAVEFGL